MLYGRERGHAERMRGMGRKREQGRAKERVHAVSSTTTPGGRARDFVRRRTHAFERRARLRYRDVPNAVPASRPVRLFLAASALFLLARGLGACQDTFPSALPLYDAGSEDANELQGEDSGSDASLDGGASDAGDAGDAAMRADAADGTAPGDGAADGSDAQASDAGEAGVEDGGDASSDADANSSPGFDAQIGAPRHWFTTCPFSASS